ncbi:hypothetical protein F4678DRAFT_456580 [Xylaria arbuscula]|nr:hypothetical protein F4678DRAFT_456580 [Xylaria arbuscula]
MPQPMELGRDAIDPEPPVDHSDSVGHSKSPVLRLPYELLLAIFHALCDQSSIDSLANAHPAMAVVRRENRDSICEAMRYNFLAEFAREATGCGSLELARISLSLATILFLERSGFESQEEVFFHYFSKSWVVSDEDLRWLKKWPFFRSNLKEFCTLAKYYELVGLLSMTPNMDYWYNEEFCPASERMNSQTAGHLLHIPSEIPAEFASIIVLMITELWNEVYYSSEEDNPEPSAEEFLSKFPPELALRTKQLARCYMKVCHTRRGVHILTKIEAHYPQHCPWDVDLAMGKLSDMPYNEILSFELHLMIKCEELKLGCYEYTKDDRIQEVEIEYLVPDDDDKEWRQAWLRVYVLIEPNSLTTVSFQPSDELIEHVHNTFP